MSRSAPPPVFPKGDPFGPLAAMLWATCGLSEVESRVPADLPANTTLYVADRSITASDPLALVARKRNWFAWSHAVGLRENEGKVAVVTTTAARRRRAEDSGLAEWIKDSMRVLGAYTASPARQLTQDEAKRVDKGLRTLRLLAAVGLPFQAFHSAVACYAMPAVAYGWLARAPTLQQAWSLFSQVRRGDRVCKTANRFIRACLLGGNSDSHLEILAAKHLLKAVTARDSRTIEKCAGVGHPVYVLRGVLMRMKWHSPRPWLFRHPAGYCLDLRRPVTRGEADRLCHVLRASCAWTGIGMSVRTGLICLLLQCGPSFGPLTSTRLVSCPEVCCSHGRLGHWKHVVVQCPHRPGPQSREPSCPWAGRCGWVVKPASLTSLQGVRRAQERALQALWAERWDCRS